MNEDDGFREFFAFVWWRIALLLVGVGVLLYFMTLSKTHTENDRRNAACTDVLECIDLGVAREHCDVLYPNCSKDS